MNHGRSQNLLWLALPLTLGRIQQPLNLPRLRRIVERPSYLGGIPTRLPAQALFDEWGRYCGTHMNRVAAAILAEFCVGHHLILILPADYFPPDQYMHPFNDPRPVRVYDTWTEKGTKQVCIYLLDMPLSTNAPYLEFEAATLDVFAAAHTRMCQNWSVLRALHFAFPDVTNLKDALPNAKDTVVYRNTLVRFTLWWLPA